jgi:hypothetical protein
LTHRSTSRACSRLGRSGLVLCNATRNSTSMRHARSGRPTETCSGRGITRISATSACRNAVVCAASDKSTATVPVVWGASLLSGGVGGIFVVACLASGSPLSAVSAFLCQLQSALLLCLCFFLSPSFSLLSVSHYIARSLQSSRGARWDRNRTAGPCSAIGRSSAAQIRHLSRLFFEISGEWVWSAKSFLKRV